MRVEVHQQPDPLAAGFHVSEQLCLEQRVAPVNALDLDDDKVFALIGYVATGNLIAAMPLLLQRAMAALYLQRFCRDVIVIDAAAAGALSCQNRLIPLGRLSRPSTRDS